MLIDWCLGSRVGGFLSCLRFACRAIGWGLRTWSLKEKLPLEGL